MPPSRTQVRSMARPAARSTSKPVVYAAARTRWGGRRERTRANPPSPSSAEERTTSHPTPRYSSASVLSERSQRHERRMWKTPRTGSLCRQWTMPAQRVHTPRTTRLPTQSVSSDASASACHRRLLHSGSCSSERVETPRSRPTRAYWRANAPRVSRRSTRSSLGASSSSSASGSAATSTAAAADVASPIPRRKSDSAVAKSFCRKCDQASRTVRMSASQASAMSGMIGGGWGARSVAG
mmetsp:Transcript_28515/g.94711  ORF Transcript_28515/g.94711 Transcript_28515/m.94711 type:complete len:239 (+) Transcript_28515:1534-2250(+)